MVGAHRSALDSSKHAHMLGFEDVRSLISNDGRQRHLSCPLVEPQLGKCLGSLVTDASSLGPNAADPVPEPRSDVTC